MSELSPEQFEKMKAEYASSIQGVVCDTCNSSEHVVATVRGKPGKNLQLFVKAGGNVKLSGCTRSANGYCTHCEEFIGLKV